MLDATIKHIFQYTLLSACLFCSFSCGNSKQAEDSEKAEQIMSEIKSMYAGKDYDNAMLMIDSLMKTCKIIRQKNQESIGIAILKRNKLYGKKNKTNCTINKWG